jgi:hypothetical protein
MPPVEMHNGDKVVHPFFSKPAGRHLHYRLTISFVSFLTLPQQMYHHKQMLPHQLQWQSSPIPNQAQSLIASSRLHQRVPTKSRNEEGRARQQGHHILRQNRSK